MTTNISIKKIATVGITVIAAAIMVFVALPQFADVASVSDVSFRADAVEAATLSARELGVCVRDMEHNGCIFEDATTITAPFAGSFAVTARETRGTGDTVNDCQDKEEYNLYVNGKFVGKSSDPKACEVNGTENNKNFGNVTLKAGSNSVKIVHAHPSETSNTAHSVHSILTFQKDDPLPPPTRPSCPFTAKEGRVIVNFNAGLRTDTTEAASISAPVNANLPAGKYDITLFSWDGSADRGTQSQPNEQWRVSVRNNTDSVAKSELIGDLADNVIEAERTQKVNTGLVFPAAGTVVYAKHGFYKSDNINSVVAVCAAFDRELPPPPPAPTCDVFNANPTQINKGEASTLTWETTNATSVSINQGVGSVPVDGSKSVAPMNSIKYTLTATGAGGSVTCDTDVTVEDVVTFTPWCTLTAEPSLINEGESALLTWTSNQLQSIIIDKGVVSTNLNDSESVSPTVTTTYTATGLGVNNQYVTCSDTVTVEPVEPVESSCTLELDKDSITEGESALLTWTTTNVHSLSVGPDGGTGSSIISTDLNGSEAVSPTETTTYKLLGFAGHQEVVVCSDTITVNPDVVPTDPAISIVKDDNDNNDDTQEVNVGDAAMFKITVTNTGNEDLKNVAVIDALTPACDETIGDLAVSEEYVYTCPAADVQSGFTNIATTTGNSVVDDAEVNAADDSDVTIATVVNPDKPSINIEKRDNADKDDSQTVSQGGTATFEIIVTNNGDEDLKDVAVTDELTSACNETIGDLAVGASHTYTCEATDVQSDFTNIAIVTGKSVVDDAGVENDDDSDVLVSTGGGGGGGGSSRPRCEFTASNEKINSGDDVVLTWDNTRTNDIVIEDSRGNILVDTDRSEDKDVDEDEGSITVNPTKDTTYTLTVKRGSRERTCEVAIEIDGGVSVTSTRTQPPLVAGISLSNVPYTGFEAGPTLTAIFYILLVAWSVGIGYVLVVRREPVLGFKMNGGKSDFTVAEATTVASSTVEETATAPNNLPTESFMPAQVGYSAAAEDVVFEKSSDDHEQDEMVALENHAHNSNALLSSDAIRFIINQTADHSERIALLDEVITKALAAYPREDGWMVINQERITALVHTNAEVAEEVEVAVSATEPVGVSSLAEAIVSGNVVAAYQLLGTNPIFALTDAAQDLDALYRNRKGEQVVVSEMLGKASHTVSDVAILAAIDALTSAIDGTYTDETGAVKVAVMKAVRAVA